VSAPADAPVVPVRVWDLPTRLFHWTLVLLVLFSGVSGEFAEDLGAQAMAWHQRSGYAILALLLFRLIWGFAGSTYARFSSFVRGPAAVLRYAGEMLGRAHGTAHIGHNPLGGWSVLALLAVLSLQAGTGLFIADEDLGVEGPLARLVSGRTSDAMAEIHEASFGLLLALVGIHLGAIVFYLVAKGENLVRPMLTGVKHLPAGQAHSARGGHVLLGGVVLALAAAAVWVLVTRV
jgi:cytochrome b